MLEVDGGLWSMWLMPIGVGVCLSAACGFRTFLPLLFIGAAARLGITPADSQFAWLASNAGIATLGTAAVLEVGAYYVPIVDNLLDLIATPLAMMAGTIAMLTSLGVTAGVPGWIIALIIGGGVSGAVQVTSVKARALSTSTTGGLANPVLATGELLGAATLSTLAILLPILAVVLAIVVILVVWRTWRWIRGRKAPQRRIA